MTKFARTLSALDIFDAFRNQILGADVSLQYLVIIYGKKATNYKNLTFPTF